MAVNSSETTTTNPTPDSLTFGGMVPHLQDTPAGELSLEEKAPVEQKLDITGVNSGKPVLSEDKLNSRADKIMFGFGDSNPGPALVKQHLANGQEDDLRAIAARQADEKDRDLQIQLIKDKASQGPLEGDPKRTQELESLVAFKPGNDPNTIFEKNFADKYVPIAEGLKQGQNVISDSRETKPEVAAHAEDIARVMVQKQEIAKTAAEDMKARYENTSWTGGVHGERKGFWGAVTDMADHAAGDPINFAKGFVPGYSWYKTYNAVDGTPTGSILQGNNWADQINYLYTLPPSEMHQKLRETVDHLAKDNPGLASEFADAVVNYTRTDAFIHNTGNIIDVATTVPGLAKGAVAGLKAAAGIATDRIAKNEIEAQVVQALKDHVAANAAPGATIPDTLSKMGALDQAAVLKATEKAREILESKGNISLTRPEIRSLLPSIFNPEALIADGSNLSAKQTVDLITHLTYNASKVLDRVNNLTKVGRLPEEAMAVAIRESKEALEERFKHVSDSVVDVVRRPTVPEILFGRDSRIDEFKKIANSVALKEKQSDPATWSKAEREAYDSGNWKEFSRLRGYTEKEIAEYESYQNQANALIKSYGIDQVQSWDIEAGRATHGSFEVTYPEQTPTNTGSVTILLGNREGDSFASKDAAYQYARGFLGLSVKDTEVHQRGVGFYIGVTKNWDETTPGVRNALITTENKTPSHLSYITGFLKSGNGRLSQFQNENRIAAVSGQQALVESLKDMHKSLTSLNTKERTALQRVMEDNHIAVKDPDTGEVGVFHRSIKDFNENFEKLNGRQPTVKETKAYFTAVQVNDFEYMLRNNSYYRELSRLGLETFSLKTRTESGGIPYFADTNKFLGKYVDNLPLGSSDPKHPAMVAIYHEGEKPETYSLASLNDPARLAKLQEYKDQGYKIIQTAIPNRKPGSEVFGEDIPVNFIITKDHNSHALERVQLPYKEGWHQEYPHQWYVKQPIIRRVSESPETTHHIYEGDTTAFAFHTQAEAQKYAKAMDQARLLLKEGKDAELKEFLKKNLPYGLKSFKQLFEAEVGQDGKILKAAFSKDDSFHHVSTGVSTIDSESIGLAKRYENFNDTLRSPWNLYDQVDKKFVGQRDPLLHTVKEKGTEANPVFQLARAETIDPMASLARGMTNMVRNQFMLDYRTQAIESWMAEFGSYLADAGRVSEQEMQANALHYLYNGEFNRQNVENINAINSGKLSQMAIKEFLGNFATDATGVDSFKNSLLNSVYGKFGQSVSDFVAPKILASSLDPVRNLRSFAFHTTIGLFNPIQAWQNAQTMANAMAIGGLTHGPKGFAAGHMFQFMRLNQTDATVAKLAKAAGWDEADFRECWKSFVNSGRFSIEGEHAWKDDLADPRFYTFSNIPGLQQAQKAAVSILDKGTIFFREGERMSRMVAYATAYSEFRANNPGVKLTAEAQRIILKRSDDMTANMTRASMASWQQGVFSLPTQFLSYNARLMEQFLGKDLTAAEKGRMLLVNSALYGVPIGMTLPLAGVYNPWEDVRGHFLEKGWNVDDKVFDAVNNGILGLATSMVTGRPSNISERSGPSGSALFKDILNGDKGIFDVALGSAGTKAYDAFTKSLPIVDYVASAAMGKPQDHPIFVADVVDLLRTVKSFDEATKLYLALSTGNLIVRSGINYGKINTAEAILGAVTGAVPRKISDEQMMVGLGSDRQKALKNIEKEIIKLHQQELIALANNDEESFKAYRSRIESLWIAGDFNDEEKAASLKRVYDSVHPAGDKIRYDWWRKNSGKEDVVPRYNQWLQNSQNGEQN